MSLAMVHSVTTPAAHTIASRAMLCSVNVRQWTARKIDKKATREVTEANGASYDAARVNKLLVAKESLAEMVAIAGAARAAHLAMTLPWLDDGTRILPAMVFQRHTTTMRNYRERFEASVSAFCAAYPALVADAPRSLQGLYNPADYPSVDNIRARFGFRVSFSPLPDSNDFRVDMDSDVVAQIRADMERERADVLGSTVTLTAERMRETLESMVTRLSGYRTREETGGRAEGAFHESVVNSVRELVELLPAFNLTDDSRITDLTERMKAELCGHSAAELKESADLRKDTIKAADDILAKVGSFFG